MPTPNDTQMILLLAAAQRDDDSVYPLPSALAEESATARVAKALAALLKYGFIEERETSVATTISRYGGNLSYGLFITDEGLAAIDANDDVGRSAMPLVPDCISARQTKSASVVALLRGDEGATLAELIATTGWLPHTTRAALTGLRKKGHAIECAKRGKETCYRIIADSV